VLTFCLPGGLSPFRIADLLRDAELLDEARRDAQTLITADPGLSQPQHAKLRRQMLHRYGKALELAEARLDDPKMDKRITRLMEKAFKEAFADPAVAGPDGGSSDAAPASSG